MPIDVEFNLCIVNISTTKMLFLCISRPNEFDIFLNLGMRSFSVGRRRPSLCPTHRLVTCKWLSDLNFTSAALITKHYLVLALALAYLYLDKMGRTTFCSGTYLWYAFAIARVKRLRLRLRGNKRFL